MDDPLIGRRFGPYEVRTPLGRGGMARVYRAFDHNLQREVAFKVLFDPAHQQSDFAERFLREARTLASLKHSGIVHIYNVGQQDEVNYIVQEVLPGPTLEDELSALKGRGAFMDGAEVQRVMTQLASALDYAHSRGIIHRDLKPSNIIRNDRGNVVLVDFGIAKSLTNVDKLTRTGVVMGTPTYLAPEQANGSSLTPAVDIYALGVILFELLTGRVPFDDPSPLSVALAHLSQPPPAVRSLRQDIPAAVEGVVSQALAKEPADRYPSAGALAAALTAAWAQGHMPRPQEDVSPRPSARSSATIILPDLEDAPQPAVTAGQDPHHAPTWVNPALGGQMQRPAPPRQEAHNAATTINPALAASSHAARPHTQTPAEWWSLPSPRWLAIGGVLLLLLCCVGWNLFGGGTSTSSVNNETAETTTAAPQQTGSADSGDAQAMSGGANAPTAGTVDSPAAPPQNASPDAIVNQASILLNQALGNQQVDIKTAEDLQKKLDKVAEKIAEGKEKDARKEFAELQHKIDEAEREGKMTSGVATQLRSLVEQLER